MTGHSDRPGAAVSVPALPRRLAVAALSLVLALSAGGGAAAQGARASAPESGSTSPIVAGAFDGYVPHRHIALLALDTIGNPRTRHPAEIRRIVEAELHEGLPPDQASDAELRHQVIAAYDDSGGAFVRELADGEQYCVAVFGRSTEDPARFIAGLAGGAPMGASVRADFPAFQPGIQRFLAYHEVAGHCADPALTPLTGMDRTPREVYAHAMAELRADIVATLATARDDGNTDVARTVLVLRHAYSLQAAAAPSCGGAANYGAVYRTGPGITAAIAWADKALSVPAGAPGALHGLGNLDLLAQADKIFADAKPSYDAFLRFEHRLDRVNAKTPRSDALGFAARAASLPGLDVSDRAWFAEGVDAMRKIFNLPTTPVLDLGPAVDCPPTARLAKRANAATEPIDPDAAKPLGAAGLGG